MVLWLWLFVWLFCGFLWWVVKFVFVRGVGGWCVVLHCFEVLMHVFVVVVFCGVCVVLWLGVFTIFIAGLVKWVFEDFFLWSVVL